MPAIRELFQPIDSFTYAQTALLRSYTGNREDSRFAVLSENGIGFVPHRWPRPSCRAPHPRGLASFRIPGLPLPPHTCRLASFRTSPLRVRPITQPLVPTAHGGATDLQAAGDLGFADASTVQCPHFVGLGRRVVLCGLAHQVRKPDPAGRVPIRQASFHPA